MQREKLILLPGLDGTGEFFEPLLGVISTARETKVIHYPVDKKLSYDELVTYVIEVIKNDGCFYLVAESFSGPIAIKLLSRLENRIKGLILVASFISPPRRFLLILARLVPFTILLKFEIPDLLIRRYCLGEEIDDALIAQFKKIIKLVTPGVLMFRLNEILKLDLSTFESASNQNIYYIEAENDKLVTKESLVTLKSVLNIQSFSVKGPHLLLQAKPVQCSQLILNLTA